MTIITRNNYEEFFIDYIEGEIGAQDKEALEAFLVQHPDLKKELDGMMNVDFICDAATIETESTLLKEIPFQENFDDFCIAHFEGDLDTYEKKAFENYMASHSEKKIDLKLYKKTKVTADSSIIFANKKGLKKKNKAILFRQFIFTTLATAASIAILFSVWSTEIENNPPDVRREQVSQNTSMQIATPDSIKRKISKEVKTKKNPKTNKTQEKGDNSSKPIIKGKIQNKRIIKTDALPIRAEVTPKESIEKIVVKQLLADNKTLVIENNNLPKAKINILKKTSTPEKQNTGLAMLGLSWKASKTEKEVKDKSALLKIASFGVNQIGKLAGKKINLEKKYDPKTDKTRVAFNTLGIGFSTPVK
jgi:hypothetical protein